MTPTRSALTEDQIQRYARQLILPEIGGAGQEKLGLARVLCVGAGGLGGPAALYLAAAGVGTLGLADPDPVDLSNLQRQILFTTQDVGRSKVESAQKRLAALNPDIQINAHAVRIDASTGPLIDDYDIILDGSDNFDTRYAVNALCVQKRKTLISGAVLQFEGQITTLVPGHGPCYECLFPERPDPGCEQSCADAGILGAAAGVVGSLMSAEAVKWVLGLPGTLVGRLFLMNLLTMNTRLTQRKRRKDCPVCSGLFRAD